MKTVFGFKNFIRLIPEYLFVLFFTTMIWTICLDVFFLEKISLPNRQLISGISLVLTSAVYFYFRPKLYKKYDYWELKGDYLVRGNPTNLEVYLPSIELVIKGLPKPLPGFQMLRFNLVNFKYPTLHGYFYANTIIIKLGQNTYLPLYLNHLDNGSKLMDEISKRLMDKMLSEYDFNYKERRLITPGKCNRLININI